MLDIPALKTKTTAQPARVRDGADTSILSSRPPMTRPARLTHPKVLTGLIVACIAFFAVTTPDSVPSVLLIVGFIVLGVLLYSLIMLTLVMTGLHTKLPKPYTRSILLTGTLLPVILLLMQSIGQLTVRDVLTLGALFAIGVFYSNHLRRLR